MFKRLGMFVFGNTDGILMPLYENNHQTMYQNLFILKRVSKDCVIICYILR